MRLAMIGLGKMGANMATRLIHHGHEVVVFDINRDAVSAAAQVGGIAAFTLEEVKAALEPPRIAWVMVPAGKPTDATVSKLGLLFENGDVVIDGGNSNYKDSVRHGKELAERGIRFVDVGTSGGVWGLSEGYSMMVGGSQKAVDLITPVLSSLAPAADKGWGRVGDVGAGHFVKMVHNGIEYGLMQAYAEGFAVMEKKPEYDLDLAAIAEIWRHGSVVRSWLLDLTADALKENPALDGIAPYVPDSGEGRWTVKEAIDLDVAAPVITLALLNRLRSREDDSFGDKLLSAMRNQFGGHNIKKAE
jgi:6-phosphogluconate dehydrogenase